MAEENGMKLVENHDTNGLKPQVDLPIEIIIYIMEHLTLSDRISASQVSRAWYEASQDKKLHEKEVIVLHDNFSRSLDCLLDSSGTFINFLFKEVELNAKLLPFWDKFSPQIRCLSIHSCVVAEKMIVDILSRCYNLEYLSLNNCRELLMSGRVLETEADILSLRKALVNLRELRLTHNRYMSDAIFHRFVSIAPNIQDIALAGCQITFHHGLYQKFYPSAMTEENNFALSESVFTFNVILKYIKEQANKLHTLRLGQTLVDNAAIHELTQVSGLKLQCLHLQSCNQLSNSGIIELTHHQKSLTELDLSECSRLTDRALISICKNLTNLKNLSIRNCRAVTNIGVREMTLLDKLEYLNLAQCKMVTGEGVVEGICPKVNRKLRSLNVCALLMDEESVCKVSENLPNLRFLDLSWCFNAVTDLSAQAICSNLLSLQTLKLTGCNKVSDAGITGRHIIDVSDPADFVECDEEEWNDALHKINLRSRAEREIVDDAHRKKAVYRRCLVMEEGTESNTNSINRLEGLLYLDISACNRISDVSLQYAFHFLGLQYLDLSRCQQVSHIGMEAVAKNNPSIETLIMSNCFNVTDQAVTTVVQHLKRLKHLDVQGCKLLTDDSLEAMQKYGARLQYINISNCPSVTYDMALELEQSLPSLQFIHRAGLRSDLLVSSSDVSLSVPPPPPPPGKKTLFRFFHR